VLRVGVLSVVVVSLAGTNLSLAQSMESQGYRYNRAQDVWAPVPAYLQPLAKGDAEFIRLLTGQGYYFNRLENTWMPRANYLSGAKQDAGRTSDRPTGQVVESASSVSAELSAVQGWRQGFSRGGPSNIGTPQRPTLRLPQCSSRMDAGLRMPRAGANVG
jgi:hypothetical protein